MKTGLATLRQTAEFLKISFLAIFLGAMSECVAKVLLWLIALITNLAFFGAVVRFPSDSSAEPRRDLGDCNSGDWGARDRADGSLWIGQDPLVRGRARP